MEKKSKYFFIVTFLLLLSLSFVFGSLITKTSSSCSGMWTSCTNVNANDFSVAFASPTSTLNISGTWIFANFTESLVTNDTINNISLRIDTSNNNSTLDVIVSGNGGVNFGNLRRLGNTTSEQSFFIDLTPGATWVPENFTNSNFRVNTTCARFNTSLAASCRFDYLLASLDYTSHDFSLSLNPTGKAVLQGVNISSLTMIQTLTGYPGNVTLSLTGCPGNSTCAFDFNSEFAPYNSTLTVITTPDTPLGNYTLNVTSSNTFRFRSSLFKLNVTTNAPIANASADPVNTTANSTVNFTGLVTGGDVPLEYLWDFKDGTNSSSQHPLKNFSLSGTFNVSFKARDIEGDESFSYVFITVT